MRGSDYSKLAALAEQRWGLVTTAQAEHAGVSRMQLSRFATAGGLVRVAKGVYRIAGAPELPHEPIYATWLALGGATLPKTPDGVRPVIAAGATAAVLHGIGDLWPDGYDFIVPKRRGTRLPGVRLRIRSLTPPEVAPVNGLPTLTVERTIADLVEQWTDLSLVADVVRDAILQGKLVSRQRLAQYLAPTAAEHGQTNGDALAEELITASGVDPLVWAGNG